MDAGKVGTVLVAGAGVMGHSIAQVFAQAGIEVDLADLNEQALTRAMALIRTNLHTLAEFGRVPGKRYTGDYGPHKTVNRSDSLGAKSRLCPGSRERDA